MAINDWAMIFENLAADGTFTANNDSAYPESNLKNTRTDKIYQYSPGSAISSEDVVLNLGASNSLIGETDYGIIWGGSRQLTDDAQLTIITATNFSFIPSTTVRSASDMFDVTYNNPLSWAQPWGRHCVTLASVAAKQYFKFTFSDASSNILDGSFVYIGRIWSPGQGPQKDWKRTPVYMPGGRVFRQIEITFETISQSEAVEVFNIFNYITSERRVFIIPKTDKSYSWLTESMLCTLVEDSLEIIEWDDGPAHYVRISVKFIEVDY